MSNYIQRKIFRAVKAMRYDILNKELLFYERRSLSANSILFVGYDVGIEMLTFLLEHGINPNEQDNIGNVVLNYAAAENDIFAIETLIKFGALLDVQNIYGEDAFSFACVKGSLESAVFLYKNGAKALWIKKNWTEEILRESNFIKGSIKEFIIQEKILNN